MTQEVGCKTCVLLFQMGLIALALALVLMLAGLALFAVSSRL